MTTSSDVSVVLIVIDLNVVVWTRFNGLKWACLPLGSIDTVVAEASS